MTEIISCKEYNKRAYNKYKKAVDKHTNHNEGGFPNLSFYIFEKHSNGLGEPRNYGYVLINEHCSKWFKTKKQAYKEVKQWSFLISCLL